MNLNFSNRPVRTRMPGGVGGVEQRCSPLSRLGFCEVCGNVAAKELLGQLTRVMFFS